MSEGDNTRGPRFLEITYRGGEVVRGWVQDLKESVPLNRRDAIAFCPDDRDGALRFIDWDSVLAVRELSSPSDQLSGAAIGTVPSYSDSSFF